MPRATVRYMPKSQVLTPQQRAEARAETMRQEADDHERRGNRFMAERLRTHAANLLAGPKEPTKDILDSGNYGPEFHWVYDRKTGAVKSYSR